MRRSRRTVTAITVTAVCIGLVRVTTVMPASPADKGKLAFNNFCRTCHSLKEGDNRLGPSLYRIVGAKVARFPDYAYSQGLRQSAVTWDPATLDRWIENPESLVPNNNMKPYNGLTDAAVRKTIVDFLQNSRDGS